MSDDLAGRMVTDPEIDVRYIYVRDVESSEVKSVEDLGLCHVRVAYDARGHIVGVELL